MIFIFYLFPYIVDIMTHRKLLFDEQNIINVLDILYSDLGGSTLFDDDRKMAFRAESGIITTAKDFGEKLKDAALVQVFSNRDIVMEGGNGSRPVTSYLFNGETARLDFTTLESGPYRIMIDMTGHLQINIDGTTKDVYSDNTGRAYLGPIEMEKGNHTIIVTSLDNSTIDDIWLYTDTGTETIIANPGNNSIHNTSGSDAFWSADINLSTPALLTLSMPYDPNWRLFINGHEITPIRSYNDMVGFWIVQTGPTHIEIKFILQALYDGGRVIGLTTLGLIATYVVIGPWYERRKRIRESNHGPCLNWFRRS
jgi:hypothetical protein